MSGPSPPVSARQRATTSSSSGVDVSVGGVFFADLHAQAAALHADDLGGAHDARQVDHHAADGAEADDHDGFTKGHVDQFEAVDGAAEGLGEGGVFEERAGVDRGDRAFFQQQARQFHVFAEGAGNLVADRVVDRTVVAEAVAAPGALAAGDVGAKRDAVANLHARDVLADGDDGAGSLVPDDRGWFHARVAVMQDADIAAADADGFGP